MFRRPHAPAPQVVLRESSLVRDTAADPNYNPEIDGRGCRSVATAPILHTAPAASRRGQRGAAQAELIGVIQVRWTGAQAAPPTEEDEV